MKIRNKAVLCIVDKDSKVLATSFLKRESSKNVWEAFLFSWEAACTGFADKVLQDKRSQFQSSEFRSLLHAASIDCFNTGIKSHNAIDEAEQYHPYLQNIFERDQAEHPTLRDVTK